MPIVVRALLVALAAVAGALLGRAMLNRFIRTEQVTGTEGSADLVMEAMAGLYGVLLAFMLAGAWQRFDETRGAIVLEANAIANLRRIARVLPSPVGEELNTASESYRVSARAEMAGMAESTGVDTIVTRLWQTLTSFQPTTPAQTELQSRALDAVDDLTNQRWMRLSMIRRTLHPLIWIILLGGAGAVLSVVAISRPGRPLPAFYLALLAMVLAFALYTIRALSQPARSGVVAEMTPFVDHLFGRPPGND